MIYVEGLGPNIFLSLVIHALSSCLNSCGTSPLLVCIHTSFEVGIQIRCQALLVLGAHYWLYGQTGGSILVPDVGHRYFLLCLTIPITFAFQLFHEARTLTLFAHLFFDFVRKNISLK